MSELREQIRKVLPGIESSMDLRKDEEMLVDIFKQWAKDCVPEGKQKMSHEDLFEEGMRIGQWNCRAEMLKKIEESD